jgi:hypothetical protein
MAVCKHCRPGYDTGVSGGHMIIEDIFGYAHSTPDKIALWDRGQAVTYAEFAYWIGYARKEMLNTTCAPAASPY